MEEERINELYGEVFNAIKKQEFTRAKRGMEDIFTNYSKFFLADKIDTYFSFQDAIEVYLYMLVSSRNIEFKQTTIDNSGMYKTYADILIAQNEFDKAIDALELSIKWDPVNVDAILGLADGYKFKGDAERYIACTKKALDFSLNSRHLAWAYRSLGDYFEMNKEYDAAICSYLVSNSFMVQNSFEEIKIVEEKLAVIEKSIGKPIKMPTVNEAKELLLSKGIKIGASDNAVNAIVSLKKEAENRKENAIVQYCMEAMRDLGLN